MSTNLASLKSDADFKANIKKMQVIENSIKQFNDNLDYSNMVNTLTGRAKTIAIDVQNNIVPKLKTEGGNVAIALGSSTAALKFFCTTMISSANALKNQNTHLTVKIISQILVNLSKSIQNAQTQIEKFLVELDLYHSNINALISDFNAEKIELANENEKVRIDEDKIIEKLKAQTHTVCGVIKTIVSALTFQLEGQLRKAQNEMAQLQYRYNINLVAIHSTDGLNDTVKSYLSLVEQAKSFWGSLDANITIINQDVSDLISDPSSWSIGWQGVQDDWQEVLNNIN